MKSFLRTPLATLAMMAVTAFIAITASNTASAQCSPMEHYRPCNTYRVTVWYCTPDELPLTVKINFDDGSSVTPPPYTAPGPHDVTYNHPPGQSKMVSSVDILGVNVPNNIPWTWVTKIPIPNKPGRCYIVDIRNDDNGCTGCPHIHIICDDCNNW